MVPRVNTTVFSLMSVFCSPLLTWRDVQHIIVRTSKTIDHTYEDWTMNGAGRYVSHAFGYGVLDAEAVVGLAMNWTQVPKQHLCVESYTETLPG